MAETGPAHKPLSTLLLRGKVKQTMSRPSPRLATLDWKVRRAKILAALNRYDRRTSTPGRKYFIWFKGHSFPPKEIRKLVERRAKSTFSGGGKTNEIFRDLGFSVLKWSDKQLADRKHVTDKGGIPALFKYRDVLFGRRWKPLWEQIDSGRLENYPGVYALAYAHEDMEGKRVSPEDVFYVGMSTTSLRTRLRQFWDGIHDGAHHSGAKTFFEHWAGSRPYKRLARKGTFYVATVPIRCETQKGLRTAKDLQHLGLVAALEFYVLAHIKHETDMEPPLNKK